MVGDEEQVFLQASAELREGERRQAEELRQRELDAARQSEAAARQSAEAGRRAIRYLVAGLAVALMIAIVAVWQWDRAEDLTKIAQENAAKAQARQLAAEEKARRLSAPGVISNGKYLARQGNIKEAIAALSKAQKLDPTLQISAETWNTLCWNGSLRGYAAEVMDACQRGVELAPDSGSARDSRGVARALTGDTAGAIADFQAYIEWANYHMSFEKAIKKRQEWIQSLKAGRNPFDKATLKALRRE